MGILTLFQAVPETPEIRDYLEYRVGQDLRSACVSESRLGLGCAIHM